MANFDQQLRAFDDTEAIAARAAILELACVYARAVDRRDFELLAACSAKTPARSCRI